MGADDRGVRSVIWKSEVETSKFCGDVVVCRRGKREEMDNYKGKKGRVLEIH